MSNKKFEEIKPQILDALQKRSNLLGINEPDGVALVDGFINQPIQKELSGGLVIGGPAIPMVAIVGNSTGRIYFFALKALLPDIKI